MPERGPRFVSSNSSPSISVTVQAGGFRVGVAGRALRGQRNDDMSLDEVERIAI